MFIFTKSFCYINCYLGRKLVARAFDNTRPIDLHCWILTEEFRNNEHNNIMIEYAQHLINSIYHSQQTLFKIMAQPFVNEKSQMESLLSLIASDTRIDLDALKLQVKIGGEDAERQLPSSEEYGKTEDQKGS